MDGAILWLAEQGVRELFATDFLDDAKSAYTVPGWHSVLFHQDLCIVEQVKFSEP